jgi:hypothetical protein
VSLKQKTNPSVDNETNNIVKFLINIDGGSGGGLGLKLCWKVGGKKFGCWFHLGFGNRCRLGICISGDDIRLN